MEQLGTVVKIEPGDSVKQAGLISSAFTGMSDAAENFISKGADLSLVGMGLSKVANMVLSPLADLGKEMMDIGEKTEFSMMRLDQFSNVLGMTGAESLTKIRGMAEDTVSSVEQMQSMVEDSASMGIDATKSYGEGFIAQGSRMLSYQKSFAQAASDVAIARNVETARVMHDSMMAITTGNIWPLETILGRSNMVTLQMMGGLTGTLQDRARVLTLFFDKVYGGMARKASETFEGMKVGLHDMFQFGLLNIVDIKNPMGMYQTLMSSLGTSYDKLRKYFVSWNGSTSEQTKNMKAFAEVFHTMLAPAIPIVATLVAKLADFIVQGSKWASTHATFVAFFGRGLGITGLALAATSAMLMFSAAIFKAVVAIKDLFIAFAPMSIATIGFFASIAAAMFVFRTAWDRDWGGIRETVNSFVAHIETLWTKIGNFFGAIGDIIRTAANGTFLVHAKYWDNMSGGEQSFLTYLGRITGKIRDFMDDKHISGKEKIAAGLGLASIPAMLGAMPLLLKYGWGFMKNSGLTSDITNGIFGGLFGNGKIGNFFKETTSDLGIGRNVQHVWIDGVAAGVKFGGMGLGGLAAGSATEKAAEKIEPWLGGLVGKSLATITGFLGADLAGASVGTLLAGALPVIAAALVGWKVGGIINQWIDDYQNDHQDDSYNPAVHANREETAADDFQRAYADAQRAGKPLNVQAFEKSETDLNGGKSFTAIDAMNGAAKAIMRMEQHFKDINKPPIIHVTMDNTGKFRATVTGQANAPDYNVNPAGLSAPSRAGGADALSGTGSVTGTYDPDQDPRSIQNNQPK